MLTSRLLKIDDAIRSEHYHLAPEDFCYYFGEYYSRQGYGHSPMNQLIYNFKKYMNQKEEAGWHYKEKAIKDIVSALLSLKAWERLKYYTWIPIPSSKIKADPEYDDRLMQVLLNLKKDELNLDFREIFSIKSGRIAAHDPAVTKRPSISDHLNNFQLNAMLLKPSPKAIVVFDDVITTGASFKAIQILLKKEFPKIPLIGIFIARNIIVGH